MIIKPAYKKLDVNKHFHASEVVVDRVGNIFVKRQAVAAILGVSLVALATTYKKKGLLPIDHYVGKCKPYLLEDVEQMYNARAK